MSDGWMRDADAAAGPLVGADDAAAVERDLAAAAVERARRAGRRLAPVIVATNGLGGPLDQLGGGAELAQRPVDDHADAVGERGGVAEVVA